jgi:hypothetical protein
MEPECPGTVAGLIGNSRGIARKIERARCELQVLAADLAIWRLRAAFSSPRPELPSLATLLARMR